MRKPRDYQAEYARRIERGRNRGLSRSQARGHPKAKEKAASAKKGRTSPQYDQRLEQGLKLMRSGSNLTQSAQVIGVSRERLRRYISKTGIVRRKGNRWVFRKDNRKRELLIYTRGKAVTITVAGYEPAARIGTYMSAVGQFLTTNNLAHLDPFVGESVQDVAGKHYFFETNPNTLYRLAETSVQSFEQIYRIVV
jgi:hypothetical protein